MPGFDGTGPNGKGPMTGKGRGYCVVRLNRKLATVDKGTNNSPDIKNPNIKKSITRIYQKKRKDKYSL
jgi:hypothetical protein